jgi:hypothetical protein
MISCGRLCINLHDFSGEKIIFKFRNLAQSTRKFHGKQEENMNTTNHTQKARKHNSDGDKIHQRYSENFMKAIEKVLKLCNKVGSFIKHRKNNSMHLCFANAFSLWNQPFVDTYVYIEQNE